MEIKPTGSHSTQQSRSAAENASAAKGAKSSAATPSGNGDDKVTMTNQANQMLQLEGNLADIPDVDNERVQAIKAALENGSYQIDTEKLVTNLLSAQSDFA